MSLIWKIPQSILQGIVPLGRNGLDLILQLLQIATDNSLLPLLTVLEEHKGRHGSHLHLLGDGADLIHIDLDEAHIGVGFAELADVGSDLLAGAAPGGEEVDDDGAGRGEGLEDDGTIDALSAMAVQNAGTATYLSTSTTLPWAMVVEEPDLLRVK